MDKYKVLGIFKVTTQKGLESLDVRKRDLSTPYGKEMNFSSLEPLHLEFIFLQQLTLTLTMQWVISYLGIRALSVDD